MGHHGTMTLREARAIIGSLGFPSKMPGTSYGLPAAACIAGSRLARRRGSICSLCYALRGRAKYQMPSAAKGQTKRLNSITNPKWVEAMTSVLKHTHSKPIRVDLGLTVQNGRLKPGMSRYRFNEAGYHRWHDTGDIQSLDHLAKIIEVCRRTPEIRHWLPTRELSIVRSYAGVVPDNLIIRISATMIDGVPPPGWPATSTVHNAGAPIGFECRAFENRNECGPCRACWDHDIANVSYRLHRLN